MHHYFEAITNTSGDSLIGYFARVIDPATQNTVTLSADNNGTPIVTTSGVENMAKTDENGNLSLYVQPGTYHLDIYAPNATSFIMRVPNVAMNSTKGDKGDIGNPGPSDNTYTDFSAFRAQSLGNTVSRLAIAAGAANYTFVTGDFSGQPDNKHVIASTLTTPDKGAWLRQQMETITALQVGRGAVLRDAQEKANERVSLRDFGAIGDGILHAVQEWIVPFARARFPSFDALKVAYPHVTALTDSIDWAATQAVHDYLDTRGGGTADVGAGDFVLNRSVRPRDRVTMLGEGGHVGSVFTGLNAISLFASPVLRYAQFLGIGFSGFRATAFEHTPDSNGSTQEYWEHCQFWDCHFYGQLADGLKANCIFLKYHLNSAGFYGTVDPNQPRSRHLCIQGTSSNPANSNRITGNRFYHGKGGESVLVDTAVDLVVADNNFEQNDCLPLRLRGTPLAEVERNWFELNGGPGVNEEISLEAGTFLVDLSPLVIHRNVFALPHSSIVRLVTVAAPFIAWSFDYNGGNAVGKQFTNDASKIISCLGNRFNGLVVPDRVNQESGSWNVVDASGAGLSIPAAGVWERQGKHIDAHIDFTFPANGNNANAKIGGFPYPAGRVAVGSIISTYPGALQIAMDANANTASFFVAGSLTPLNNSQLAGRSIYISIRYPAA